MWEGVYIFREVMYIAGGGISRCKGVVTSKMAGSWCWEGQHEGSKDKIHVREYMFQKCILVDSLVARLFDSHFRPKGSGQQQKIS